LFLTRLIAGGIKNNTNLPMPGLTKIATSNDTMKIAGRSRDRIFAFVKKSPAGKSSATPLEGLPI